MTRLSHTASLSLAVALLAVAVLPARAEEEPDRGWMGVSVAPLGEEKRAEIEYEGEGALVILHVFPESPAAKAGLSAGDILLRVFDTEILGFDLLAEILSDTVVGQKMPCRVWRAGEAVDVTLVLGPRPAEHAEEHPERVAARRELEILRLAMKAFLEKEKKDAAHRIEHGIHARELRLEGQRGEEAEKVFRTEPKRADLGKLLLQASKIWAEFGHEEKAALCEELGKRYLAHGRGAEENGVRVERAARIRQLAAQLREIAAVLRRLAREIEELRDER